MAITIEPTQAFWDNFLTRKSWKPSSPEPFSGKSKAPNTIERGLLLRGLEIPVKEFILEGLERSDLSKLGPGASNVLLRNTQDEDKHDLALNRCAAAHAHPDRALPSVVREREAESLINDWIALDVHPFTKAAVLENGVFFVLLPIFNLYGFQALAEASQWISQDERMHVQTHRAAAQLLRAAPTKQLNELRVATVEWLLADFAEEASEAEYQRFRKSSDMLMLRGLSVLNETQFASVPAFFETRRNHFAKYN